MDCDIVIVGGGIAGASLGAAVAGRVRTVILEAEAQCGVHSTGRSAAFFLESYGGPEVAMLNRASASLLNAPPADFTDSSFLRPRGAIHLSQDEWPHLPEGVASERLDRTALDQRIPGLRASWTRGLLEPNCADIDVARLHAAFLAQFRRVGGMLRCSSRMAWAACDGKGWRIGLEDGTTLGATILVNAAGAWADSVAQLAGVAPLGLRPMRRTMIQLRVGRGGLADLPLVIDWRGQFYFKGEGDRSIWLSPHDEIPTEPCDAAPEEIDIATAIDRFEQVVDWPVEAVERKWAGLRTFAPDRLPVYGFDPGQPRFFWCAGQGGFGIQSSPAAGRLAAALIVRNRLPSDLAGIDPAVFAPSRFANC